MEASHKLLAAIDGGDYGAYARLCDPGLTAFEPEAQGAVRVGMKAPRMGPCLPLHFHACVGCWVIGTLSTSSLSMLQIFNGMTSL